MSAQPRIGAQRPLEIHDRPAANVPSVVTRSVSGDTSTVNPSAAASSPSGTRRSPHAVTEASSAAIGVATLRHIQTVRLDALNRAGAFNQSREHRTPSAIVPEHDYARW
jgi:hypothetical protein